MARPRRPERNRVARSFRQLRRFRHVINADKVFGTHRWCPPARSSLSRRICRIGRRLCTTRWNSTSSARPARTGWTRRIRIYATERCIDGKVRILKVRLAASGNRGLRRTFSLIAIFPKWPSRFRFVCSKNVASNKSKSFASCIV